MLHMMPTLYRPFLSGSEIPKLALFTKNTFINLQFYCCLTYKKLTLICP